MKQFIGTGVALITPFNEDLTIDFKSLEQLIEHNIANGTDYLVISGTTGESATITADEKRELVDFIAKINNKRLPLVLGIGGNNTQKVIAELKQSDLNDIDAILSVSPSYSKPTQEGIYQHFKAVAEATTKPIILYNVPGRTASNMLPETIIRLANDFENIIGVKEAAGLMSQYLELLRTKPDDFLIISGDDDLALPVVLAGGAGVISVIGQAVTKPFTKMINLGLEKKPEAAFAIYYRLMNITRLIFSENNPSGVKALLKKMSLADDFVRLPLVDATSALKKALEKALKEIPQ